MCEEFRSSDFHENLGRMYPTSSSTIPQEQLTAKKSFHNHLTLPKSTEKCLLEQDLNSHLRDTGLFLFMYLWGWFWNRNETLHAPVSWRCKFQFRSSQHFSVDFGSVRISWKHFFSRIFEDDSKLERLEPVISQGFVVCIRTHSLRRRFRAKSGRRWTET